MKIDENKKKYSISEFAKACGTTKDTLYHYEKQGLLCPSTDETNHYRYYSLDDFHLFQYIAHLRRLGFSVSEIRDCLQERNVKTYLRMLEQSQQKWLDEIAEAKRRYDIVTKTRAAAFEYTHTPLEKPRIEYAPEEYFYIAVFRGDLNSLDGVNQLRHHLASAEIRPDITNNLMVFRTDRKRLSSDYSGQISIMLQTDGPDGLPEEQLHIKPAGFYLHICFCLDLLTATEEERTPCLRKIKNYIEEHNYSVTTDLYEYSHIGRFLTDDPKEYLTEFLIGIE